MITNYLLQSCAIQMWPGGFLQEEDWILVVSTEFTAW